MRTDCRYSDFAMSDKYERLLDQLVQSEGWVTATELADQLGVKGCIANHPNGNVAISAEGDPVSLEMFLDWCHEAPERAEVTSVESHEGELKNYRNFEVVKKADF